MTTATLIVTALNILCCGVNIGLFYAIRQQSKAMLSEAEEYDSKADETLDQAKMLVRFANELSQCEDEEDRAEVILRWRDILKQHGIDIRHIL